MNAPKYASWLICEEIQLVVFTILTESESVVQEAPGLSEFLLGWDKEKGEQMLCLGGFHWEIGGARRCFVY